MVFNCKNKKETAEIRNLRGADPSPRSRVDLENPPERLFHSSLAIRICRSLAWLLNYKQILPFLLNILCRTCSFERCIFVNCTNNYGSFLIDMTSLITSPLSPTGAERSKRLIGAYLCKKFQKCNVTFLGK